MRNWNVIDKKLDCIEDEVQAVENYVKEKGGKVVWGFVWSTIEDGAEVIKYIAYVSKTGFFIVPLREINSSCSPL